MDRRHVVLVASPIQSHINPSLQFAKRLIDMGIKVTFVTSVYAQRRMAKTTGATHIPPPDGLTFASFSDGFDDGFKLGTDDINKYKIEIIKQGSKALKDIIARASDQGRPVTCLVYTLLLPWASDVAREHHIPRALLWIQPATVMCIYYYYFNGYGDEIMSSSKSNPAWEIQLPGIPLTLSKRDLPSFMFPDASNSNMNSFVLTTFQEQLDALDAETKAKVLVNTFDALESAALRAIDHKYDLIGVGPLTPSDPSDKSFRGDLFQKSDDVIEWLNSKPDSSVVYVSFGSILNLQKAQMEEIARGLLDSGRPFLWVIRERTTNEVDDNDSNDKLSCLEEVEKIGKIVGWCSQIEVLTHRAVGCFVTHCGWNSTLESLSCGVPVVAFPHWTDQGTNAKLIEDAWGIGVRVRENGDGVVESCEIRRCVEEVMGDGEKSREVKENAAKWKGLAREAIGENGSSHRNLKAFLDEVGA